MNNMTSDKVSKKILFFGLDNSGKTSILLSLKKETNLLSFYTLKPTKGLNVYTLGNMEMELACWDFGGQEEYRIGYLENFSDYIADIFRLYYIIDVQDIKRYNVSLEYLSSILKKLKENNVHPEISIYLHKYDPNIATLIGFENIDKIIKTDLIPKVKALISNNFKFDIYRTTIYTSFERTLEIL